MNATTLVGLGIRTYLAGRIGRLSNARHWQENAAGIQLAQLRSLLGAASGTEFGKAHDFATITALPNAEILPAYRKAVPIADWYAYKDMIARMREGGEPNVLWPGLIRDYAQTSGTTAGDKYIPVSAEMLRSNFRASLDIFAHLARFGVSLPWLTTGKSLFLGGSTNLSTNAHGVRTGDLSGIVTPLIRWPVSEIYLPGRDIALMSHWPDKIEAMATRCLREDVRMVSGMCSWALVLFERVMELARKTNPAVRTIADVWPNFRVFVHGGVKYAPFDARVRAAFSGSPEGADIPTRLELYPASEGFVAIQDTPRDPGLRLLTDIGNFAEFVPLEAIDRPDAPAYACHEVEKGQKYVVVLSTCAGLWRYILGDVVIFDTVPDRPHSLGGGGGDGPPRLRIVGRHRHFINAFGENLIVEHVENAVAHAARAAGVTVGEFTAAPVYPRDGVRPGLELLVEIDGPRPGGPVIAAFRDAFDASLKDQNADYTTKRTSGVGMAEPMITPVPCGTFHRWLESRGKLGGQHKCPRCANERTILEAVAACEPS
ncbi:MAG: hypothetical protein HBSAPP03_05820 [Phycisphaerae bacterium]|nr:MAG: hypothetical protein HBSAPP03_05820 [Phycisphaerae bacterium]